MLSDNWQNVQWRILKKGSLQFSCPEEFYELCKCLMKMPIPVEQKQQRWGGICQWDRLKEKVNMKFLVPNINGPFVGNSIWYLNIWISFFMLKCDLILSLKCKSKKKITTTVQARWDLFADWNVAQATILQFMDSEDSASKENRVRLVQQCWIFMKWQGHTTHWR